MKRLAAVIVLMVALTACSGGALETTGAVLDILAGPSPQEQCERDHGTWVQERTYNVRTGELERTEERCITEVRR